MAKSIVNSRSLTFGVLLFTWVTLTPCSYAQVVTNITADGTLGTTVTPAGNIYNIDGGTVKGTNQFHSFGQFDVGTGDAAIFNGPAGTLNVISRVTGGAGSQIDGALVSNIAGANLFLVNPAGILFGPNAQLAVDGSFHATTADYVGLADGNHFNAVPSPADALLTAAAPAAFGFLTSSPAPIDVQTGVFDFNVGAFANVLQGAPGQTLSFVGGSVNVGAPPGSPPAGFVFASGGRINLASVASPGEAAFDGTNINVDTFSQLGDINITGNSIVDAREVFIRGGHLTISGGTVFPGLFFLAGAPVAPPDGGEVNIDVSDAVDIIGQPPVLAATGINTFAGAAFDLIPGDVPDIHIKARSLSISDGAQVVASRLGPGNPPDVSVAAETVDVRTGAGISIVNQFDGPGGTLTVDATNVTLDSQGNPGVTGLAAQSDFHPAYGQPGVPFFPFFQFPDSGSITINAPGTLSVLGHAQISADSFAFGRSGDITINAGNLVLAGEGTNTGTIASQSGLAGQSGNVTINATGTIDLQGGFRISANTFGSGDGGAVNVTANQAITMTGESTFISSATDQPLDVQLDGFAQRFDPFFQFFFGVATPDYASLRAALGVAPGPGDLMGVLAALNAITDPGGNPLVAVTDTTPGTGGTISVTSPLLSAQSGAAIETSTAWDGDAGAVAITVGSLSLDEGAAIRSRSGADRLDRGLTAGTGNAGQINVTADNNISISGRLPSSGEGSSVTTSTFGDGNGGDIVLSAGSQVELTSGGNVSADSLALVGTGGGLTGNINITSGGSIVLSDGTISTQAVTSDGGNIKLTAPNVVRLSGSQITTSVESGVGGGGNINIDPQFIILNSSQITANAFGGPGGNISLTANNFVPSADSTVQASSALSTQGTIVIESPENDIAGSISQLPQSIVDVSGLLPERCAARGAGGAQSSFVVAGRGGLPTNPDNYLPSFSAGSGPVKSGGITKPGMSLSELRYTDQTTVAMAGWGCPR